MKLRIPIITLAVLLLTFAAQAKTLIVNPSTTGASDSHPGSDTQPLRTINLAAQLVQPGDIVQIYSGVYREKVTIAQSGTKEHPIRFEAATGRKNRWDSHMKSPWAPGRFH